MACKHRCLSLTVLEAAVQDEGTSTFGAQWELSSWFTGLLSVSSRGRGTNGLSWASLMRALTPLMRLCPHYLVSSQRPGLQIAITSYQVFSRRVMWVLDGENTRSTAACVQSPAEESKTIKSCCPANFPLLPNCREGIRLSLHQLWVEGAALGKRLPTGRQAPKPMLLDYIRQWSQQRTRDASP